MTPKQAAIAYWGNDNPPQELIAAMAEAQRPLLEALERVANTGEFRCYEDSAWDQVNDAIAATKGE